MGNVGGMKPKKKTLKRRDLISSFKLFNTFCSFAPSNELIANREKKIRFQLNIQQIIS